MTAASPTLQCLCFDASGDTDGVHTFDALASTSAARHQDVIAEVESVLAWAAQRFPDGPGDLDDGASWCHDLQVTRDGEWVTVSLSLSGTSAFGEAFVRAFAAAIGQGED